MMGAGVQQCVVFAFNFLEYYGSCYASGPKAAIVATSYLQHDMSLPVEAWQSELYCSNSG